MISKKLRLGKFILKNRIVVSPMCQYSSLNGSPSSWHYQHLGKLALSGAGMLMLESTAINKTGKITHNDLCLFNNTQEKKLKKLFQFIKKISDIAVGIQISHSGRKGSAHIPWNKTNYPLNKRERKWITVAPSSIKKDLGWPTPKKLSSKNIKELKNDFKNCAVRAKRIGFDCLEIHMAHGYLLHEFFSPISNKRNEEYGGDIKKRIKLLKEIAYTIRKIWPKNRILGARITGTDHMKNGISIQDSKYLVKELEKIGFDYVCVSSGGIVSKTKMKQQKAFRVKIASKLRHGTKIKIRTSGQIDSVELADRILRTNKCDFVAIGRKFLLDPNWLQKSNMRNKFFIPHQYNRG
jgi:2,4-dienoyl-CoA reductase-like NADH-dependent reductase (Old Yellow Enzyme family)